MPIHDSAPLVGRGGVPVIHRRDRLATTRLIARPVADVVRLLPGTQAGHGAGQESHPDYDDEEEEDLAIVDRSRRGRVLTHGMYMQGHGRRPSAGPGHLGGHADTYGHQEASSRASTVRGRTTARPSRRTSATPGFFPSSSSGAAAGLDRGPFQEVLNSALEEVSRAHDREVVALRQEVEQLRMRITTLGQVVRSSAEATGAAKGGLPTSYSLKFADRIASVLGIAGSADEECSSQSALALAHSAHGMGKPLATADVPPVWEDWWPPAGSNGTSDDKGHSLAEEVQAVVRTVTKKAVSIEDDFEEDTSLAAKLLTKIGKWPRFVGALLQVAQRRELHHLRPEWIQSEGYLEKVSLKHGTVNLTERRSVKGFDPAFLLRGRSQLLHAATSSLGHLSKTIVMEPQSRSRICWTIMGMALMLYDLVMLPLLFFSFRRDGIWRIMDWVSQGFWTMDIPMSFITGVFIESELEMDLRRIAWSYVTTWFPVDALTTSFLWVVLLLDVSENPNVNDSFKTIRYVRLLRFLRVIRLMKSNTQLNEMLELLNSSSLLVVIGIIRLMLICILMNHIIACFFWAVGQTKSDDGRVGWSYADYMEGREELYQYLTSFHWSLSQFQGNTDVSPGGTVEERAYAVGTLLFALLAFAWFIGTLTNMLLQLENIQFEQTRVERMVQGFLGRHGITPALSLKVKKYVQWRQKQMKQFEYEDEVMALLPEQLVFDLRAETRGPTLANHQLFMNLLNAHPPVVRRLCSEAAFDVLPGPGELVFCPTDDCTRMLFVVRGQLNYTVKAAWAKAAIARLRINSKHQIRRSERSIRRQSDGGPSARWRETDSQEEPEGVFVFPGTYLSEGALWVNWHHRGNLTAEGQQVLLLAIDVASFMQVMKTHPAVHASAVYYARRFLAGVNRFGRQYTDLIDSRSLQELLRE